MFAVRTSILGPQIILNMLSFFGSNTRDLQYSHMCSPTSTRASHKDRPRILQRTNHVCLLYLSPLPPLICSLLGRYRYRNSIIQMHTTARNRRPFSNLYRDPPAPTFSSSPLNWHSPQSDASSIEMANGMNPIIRVQPPSSDGASTFAPSVSTKFTRTSRTENAAWDAQQRQRRN